jgi:two-component sensor histidine kinase
MILRLVIVLCLLINGLTQTALSQAQDIPTTITLIDSLVTYNHYEKAEVQFKKVLNQLEALPSNNLNNTYKAQILFLKGEMHEAKEENNQSLINLVAAKELAESHNLYAQLCRINTAISLIYEKQENAVLSKQYLDDAEALYKKYQLDSLYSAILIRRSLQHRFFTKNIDSAIFYSYKSKEYAERYNNKPEYVEASLMLGVYNATNQKHKEAIPYFIPAAHYYMATNNYNDASILYNNVTTAYNWLGQYPEALTYNDSAMQVVHLTSNMHQYNVYDGRYRVYEKMARYDSAFFYLKKCLELREIEVKKEEAASIKKITEQYENDKKETIISSKNQQLIFTIIVIVLITSAVILLYIKNKKISYQNSIISQQVDDLSKSLEQKKILLSELQHRVKNNLQHVISLLEIQKESVNNSSIEELIRANQNRIYSMALMHKKLNVADNVNRVDMKRYLLELSDIVKRSYENGKQQVTIHQTYNVEFFQLEKALPLGLLLVELLSNSMKHAFIHQKEGIITLTLNQNNDNNECTMYYSDNGKGFDFNSSSHKGLGVEIVKGLIDQLGGTVQTESHSGFELKLFF